jgi:predicted O-linked N-acetylglucosamine transferase (SPINDLY family)
VGFLVTKSHEGVFLKSMRGVLKHLDPRKFDVVVIAPIAALPRMRREIERELLETIALPERGDQSVAAVLGARLDVLYHWEIGTDAMNYFLPMFRLAPVQCTSWGLQLTSGMSEVDYCLSSALVESAAAALHYREELLLADTLLTYQYRPRLPEAPKLRGDFGLADERNDYTCAQHLGKFHPDFDATLAQILRRDSKGVLVITEDRYNVAAQTLRERFAQTLGDMAGRVMWLPRQSEDDYRALLGVSDVLLDPPHFGGVNSTYDGLALGKPIVTCPSFFHRGRYTLGCYQKMQLLDCVAANAAAYVDLAVRLGTDAPFRSAISARIRAASAVLFEDMQAVREHERLLEIMIERARRKSS